MTRHSAVIGDTAAIPRDGEAGFAAILRERTKGVHREAERAGFIADLIRGRATRAGYALLLRNLLPVYEAMETALAAARVDPLAAPFAVPALRRTEAIATDLDEIAAEDGGVACPLLPAARTYAAAVGDAATDVPRLVAHAYARYLGDLSGGQILKPILARSLGLQPRALAFYDFPALGDIDVAKADMRRALDRIPPDAPAAAALEAEAIAAFRHNIAVSEAVQAALV